MSLQQPWTATAWSDAAQVAGMIDPDEVPDSAAGLPPHEWFSRLVEQGDLVDAIIFLAHALPRYECVAWGARALLEVGGADRHDPLLVAVLRWLDQPGDNLRRAAGELAEEVTRSSPARDLAQAVMLSGGSLTPADLPPVQPPPGTCAAMVAGAILGGLKQSADFSAALRKVIEFGEPLAIKQ